MEPQEQPTKAIFSFADELQRRQQRAEEQKAVWEQKQQRAAELYRSGQNPILAYIETMKPEADPARIKRAETAAKIAAWSNMLTALGTGIVGMATEGYVPKTGTDAPLRMLDRINEWEKLYDSQNREYRQLKLRALMGQQEGEQQAANMEASAATVAAGKNNKPGSVGIPMVNTLVSAFEPGTDKELPIGQRGELCISGPATMKGYYNKPDETAMILHKHPDGRVWVHTGDIGYIDEDGFVYLDSRIKRLIIRHDGFKVFPSMIENVVSQHPAVHQCSVVGCADKDHVQGRLPFVYIVLTPAAAGVKKKQLIQELRQMCEEELPEYVQPVAYKFVSELPMTPVGKVDYRKLEEEITPRDY